MRNTTKYAVATEMHYSQFSKKIQYLCKLVIHDINIHYLFSIEGWYVLSGYCRVEIHNGMHFNVLEQTKNPIRMYLATTTKSSKKYMC